MSTASDFDRTLETWLADVRPTSPPAGLLDQALDRVADVPRRRAWLISDRWMWGATARRAVAGGRFLLVAGSLLLLVIAIVAAVIIVGSPRPAPPFGLTTAGFITMDSANGIVVARIDGTQRHVLVPKDGESISPIWSRDGLHLAFWHRDKPATPWALTIVDQITAACAEVGATLVGGAREVKIHGEYVAVKAEVSHLEGFSGHADADGVLDWLRGFEAPPERCFVVHGEPAAADALRLRIKDELGWRVDVPEHGATFDV